MMKYCLLRECSDYDVIYGIIVIKGNTSVEEIDNAIKDIKNKYYDDGFENWMVEDVIMDLSKLGYDFEYIDTIHGDLEV